MGKDNNRRETHGHHVKDDSIKVYQDEVVITKDDLITVFPIIKRNFLHPKDLITLSCHLILSKRGSSKISGMDTPAANLCHYKDNNPKVV